jgi:hypothetical protein
LGARCTLRAVTGRFQLTDSNGLDADALLEVGIGGIVSILALQDLLATESVDKSCAAYHPKKFRQSLFMIQGIGFHIPVPLAPHTIKQNWIPFLTFFLRRILIYPEIVRACN